MIHNKWFPEVSKDIWKQLELNPKTSALIKTDKTYWLINCNKSYSSDNLDGLLALAGGLNVINCL